jgi:predicted Zn-dependent peptidase
LSKPFREKLSNGVTVIGENISSVESVAIGVWVNFGSRDEKKEENGITHLIEHMVFKGTEHFTAEEIVETVESRGGYINAFTTKEFSCYYAKVFKEDIEPTIRVLSDLVLFPRFAEPDLRNERKVVLSEMQEVYDDPEDWGMDFVEEKIFAGNSLSMPIIGKASSLKSFTSEDLSLFHSKNFTADRIVISVAGNFERTNLMNLTEKYLPQMKSSSKIFIRRNPVFNLNGKFVVHRDAGKQAHLLFGVRAPGLNDSDRYAAAMVGVILGDGSSSRLYKSVREKDGLAYSIYSYGSSYADSGILGIYACTDVNDADKAEDRIHETVNDFVKNGPTKEEVARGKAQLKAGIVFSLENLWDRASLFARDELYYREISNVLESLNLIENVKDIDIAEAARKYLIKDCVTSLKILPQKSNAERRTRRLRRTPFGTRKAK